MVKPAALLKSVASLGQKIVSATSLKDITSSTYEELNELVDAMKREYGYEPDTRLVTRELNAFKNETAESVLLRHSEKIAVVYALLQTTKEYEIVINKNLRICTDCHNFMKLVSKIEGRKLVVSDSNRVHIFNNGACNCNDFY